MILPIEKYKLMLKSSFNIQHADIVDVKVIFFAIREWNERQTVDESNSIKSKTTFVCEHTTYLTLTKRVNTYAVIFFRCAVHYSGGRHFQVLCQIFSLPQIPKTVKLSMGKVQLNGELTF